MQRFGAPDNVAQSSIAAVQGVGRIVNLKRIIVAVEREFTLGDAVGDSSNGGAEPWVILSHIALNIVKAENDIGEMAGAIGNPQFGERCAIGDYLGNRALRICKGEHLNRSAVLQGAKLAHFHGRFHAGFRVLLSQASRGRDADYYDDPQNTTLDGFVRLHSPSWPPGGYAERLAYALFPVSASARVLG